MKKFLLASLLSVLAVTNALADDGIIIHGITGDGIIIHGITAVISSFTGIIIHG